MNDSGSLQNLNDIVAPGAVAWWPMAPGWYVLAAVTVLALLWLARVWLRRWRQNRYRREAIGELSLIRSGPGASVKRLPELLKRTALSAWPREEVAGLNGEGWHRFLDESAGARLFCSGAGELLDRVAYGDFDEPGLSDPERQQLMQAAETWLRRHRVPAETVP